MPNEVHDPNWTTLDVTVPLANDNVPGPWAAFRLPWKSNSVYVARPTAGTTKTRMAVPITHRDATLKRMEDLPFNKDESAKKPGITRIIQPGH